MIRGLGLTCYAEDKDYGYEEGLGWGCYNKGWRVRVRNIGLLGWDYDGFRFRVIKLVRFRVKVGNRVSRQAREL
eukprot:1111607-Amorphochlora_amoeboformis.AAC.1